MILKMNNIYSLGPINIKLIGKNELFNLLAKELKPVKNKKNLNIDLQIKILNSGEKIQFKPKYFSGNVFFDEDNILRKNIGFSYLIKQLFNFESVTELIISPNYRKDKIYKLIDYLRSFLRQSAFINRVDQIKSIIMSYSVFWYIFHILLLKKKFAFLHASILDLNGSGIILTGTGGCGKTSTAFKLLDNSNYKYLSEDYGIISDNGKAFFNPKYMAIYGTDVRYGQKLLVEYINKKMSSIDRFQWNFMLYRKRNPLRKVSPIRILGLNRISRKVKVRDIFFLSRFNTKEIQVKPISTNDLVERCVNAAFREIQILYELMNQIHSVGYKDNNISTISELKEKTRDIYKKCFENLNKKIIYLPNDASPNEIIKVINRYIL